jgi:hypothetical protein
MMLGGKNGKNINISVNRIIQRSPTDQAELAVVRFPGQQRNPFPTPDSAHLPGRNSYLREFTRRPE